MEVTKQYLRSPEFLANPYPLYEKIRNSSDVYPAKELDSFWLMRHSDCDLLLKSPDFGKEIDDNFTSTNDSRPTSNVMEDPYRSMLFLDPPRHTRLRLLVTKAFTPKAVESMRPFVEEISTSLAKTFRRAMYFDVIRDFAAPIPAYTIAKMLGVPQSDTPKFKEWSDDAVLSLDVAIGKEEQAKADQAQSNLLDYFQELIDERRKNLADDLLSDLIRSEESGDKLSHIELLVMCNLLLIAGHETTTNLIGNGFLALIRNREQFEMLREDRSLLKSAVEEFLRYDPPVQRVSRALYRDAKFSGKLLPKGSVATAVIGSANRDPLVFESPNKLNIARKENKHLSFSAGIHYCLGAQLAKLEAEVAFNCLCDMFKQPRLYDEPVWRKNSNMHGMETLKIAI